MTQLPPLKPLSEFLKRETHELETIVLHREGTSKQEQTILLQQREGYSIKDLIDRHAPGNYRQYCDKIGMVTSNFHAILNGDRKCSLEMLNKILSGIRFEAQISTTIVIQAMPTGETVPNADSVSEDEESVFEEKEPIPTQEQPQPDSSLLVKPQELQKMLQDFPLLELPDVS